MCTLVLCKKLRIRGIKGQKDTSPWMGRATIVSRHHSITCDGMRIIPENGEIG